MSSAQAEGEDRSTRAVQEALNSPLLDDNDIAGASDILLHIITGNKELMMDEVEEITTFVQSQAGNGANLIWGNGTDEGLGDALSVTIIATGFDKKKRDTENPNKVVIDLGSIPEPVFRLQEEVDDKTPKAPSIEEPTLIVKEEQKQKDSLAAPTEKTTPSSTRKKVHTLFETTPVKEKETPVKDPVPEKKIESEPVTEKIEFEIENTMTPAKPKNEQEVKHAAERRKRLKGLSSLSSSNLADMEKVPAYQRRNVEIDNRNPSSEENVSRYTLGSDDNNNPVINKGNSFLHDNVD